MAKRKLRVKIEGARGVGRTTFAFWLKELLESLGHNASMSRFGSLQNRQDYRNGNIDLENLDDFDIVICDHYIPSQTEEIWFEEDLGYYKMNEQNQKVLLNSNRVI